MLAELSIIPLGKNDHIGNDIAQALTLIDASGVPYQLTPTGTCVEGDWDLVMPLIRRCHDRVREGSPLVITTITIEDEEGEYQKLSRNVSSVKEHMDQSLASTRPPITAETPPSHP
jgi:uncharacterized protein (TIGR00106 family)